MLTKNKRFLFAIMIIAICFVFNLYAQDPEYKELNIYTGNLDATRSDTGINGQWLRLDTTNDPLTGNLEISKTAPELDLTDENGDSAKIKRVSGSALFNITNKVNKPGGVSNALTFDGSDEYVSIANESNFDFEKTQAFSMATWYQHTSDTASETTETIIGKQEGSGNFRGYCLNYQKSNDKILIDIRTTVANRIRVENDTVLTNGVWYSVVLTYSGNGSATGINVYVNADNTQTILANNIGSTILNNENLEFAARAGGGVLTKGLIDEVAIWDRELTSGEVSDYHNSGSGLFLNPANNFSSSGTPISTNLVGLWHLNETSGATASDSSGNSNTGTLQNMEDGDWVAGKIITPGAADIEIAGLTIEDGINVDEAGIVTLGHNGANNPRIVLEGKTLRFNIGGSEKAQMDANGTLTIDNGVTTAQQAIFKAAASASENITEHQISDGTIVQSISEVGAAFFQNSTNSITGFQILDSDGGTPVFNSDTTNERIGINVATPNTSKLEVEAATNSEIALSLQSTDNGNANIFELCNASGTAFGGWSIVNNRGGKFFLQDFGAGGKFLGAITGSTFGAFSYDETGSFGIEYRDTPANIGVDGNQTNIMIWKDGQFIFSDNVKASNGGAFTAPTNQMGLIDISNSTFTGLLIKGTVGQSANLFNITDSSDNVGFAVESEFDVIIGSGAAGKDYTLTFNGETNDGVLTWMEDEDYFKFSDEVLMDSAEKINLRDTAIGIYSQADTFLDLFADGAVRIGNSSAGAPTTYVEVEPDADMTFVGSGSGLPYGNMYVPLGGITVIISDNNPVEINDASSPTWSEGQTNNTTFSDHNITVGKTGRYSISWDLSISLTTVPAPTEIHDGIMINNTATRDDGEGHVTIQGSNVIVSVTGHTIQNLSANDEISLWLQNATNTNNIDVDHGNLVITLIGG